METVCHLCSDRIVDDTTATDDGEDYFECADCGKPTCYACKSIGVARKTDHCKRCRG